MNALGFRQRPLQPPLRRLRTTLLGWFSNRPPRTQRVFVITINGRRFKRVVLADSHYAAKAAANLNEFATAGIYPRVLLERERELWVEYIEGRPVETADAALLDAFAALLATLYQHRPRRVPIGETPFHAALHADLDFLAQVGVLSESVARELCTVADRIAPSEVWIGFDCTDAILKNFVWSAAGPLRGVDVESLGADQLIGCGVAKAGLRWLGEQREPFLDRLKALGVPDFAPYLPFIELSFLAFWQKSSFLEGKRRYLDPALFERFRAVR